MNLTLITENWDLFAQGVWNTILLTFLSLVLGACLALPMAIAQARNFPIISHLIFGYSFFLRGTPLLLQAYLVYYGLSQFEVVRDSVFWPFLREAWWCALLTFSLNCSAYTAEIIRGALVNVPKGEIEAARALGISEAAILRRITLPSAARRALPAYSNEVVFMLHGSVAASTITIIDILGAGRILNAKYYVYLEGFLTAAVLYAAIVFLVLQGFRALERRMLAHLRPRQSVAPPRGAHTFFSRYGRSDDP